MNKLRLQILTIGLMLSFCVLKVNGQILQSRSDIIKEKGYGYVSGVTADGTKYIYYDKEFTTKHSGTYTQRKVFYFTKLDDGREICTLLKMLEPKSETNPNVSYMKNNFVEVEYMKWKDYETGVLYKIEVEEGLCIITAWYDFEKQ